jgi:hypothetical protein
MPRLVSRIRTALFGLPHDKTTSDRAHRRTNVRMTFVSGLVCAAYAVLGGVILAAYDEFGDQLLLIGQPR